MSGQGFSSTTKDICEVLFRGSEVWYSRVGFTLRGHHVCSQLSRNSPRDIYRAGRTELVDYGGDHSISNFSSVLWITNLSWVTVVDGKVRRVPQVDYSVTDWDGLQSRGRAIGELVQLEIARLGLCHLYWMLPSISSG